MTQANKKLKILRSSRYQKTQDDKKKPKISKHQRCEKPIRYKTNSKHQKTQNNNEEKRLQQTQDIKTFKQDISTHKM